MISMVITRACREGATAPASAKHIPHHPGKPDGRVWIAARARHQAGEGNRTLVSSLGSYSSAIELHPHRRMMVARPLPPVQRRLTGIDRHISQRGLAGDRSARIDRKSVV